MSIRTSILMVLALLIGAAAAALAERSGGVVAYYPDGTWTRYVADPSAQVVRSVEFDSGGVPSMATDRACTVIDARNWSCPAAVNSDGTPDWRWGGFRAVDGRVESTNPRDVIPPISWTTWELERIRKQL
ncbi:MAG TPA: hypothetical protein VFN79_08210 [Steroidobacteraceae bacterium]|nr:hypothetical protein [Steroidobacteraceae bacterium]